MDIKIKDQRSADRVRNDIYFLRAKIDVNVKPVLTSRKLSQTLSVKEIIPRSSKFNALYTIFQCDLCNANYVGPTDCHLDQGISEHRYSANEKHLETENGNKRSKTDHLFKVLKKCNSKCDCLAYEVLYRKDINSSLNIRAELLT